MGADVRMIGGNLVLLRRRRSIGVFRGLGCRGLGVRRWGSGRGLDGGWSGRVLKWGSWGGGERIDWFESGLRLEGKRAFARNLIRHRLGDIPTDDLFLINVRGEMWNFCWEDLLRG